MEYQKKKKKRTEGIFEAVLTENFLQINVRCLTTDPGSSENAKGVNAPNRHLSMSYSDYVKIEDAKNLVRRQRKEHPAHRGLKIGIISPG